MKRIILKLLAMLLVTHSSLPGSSQSWELVKDGDSYNFQIQFADDQTIYLFDRGETYNISKSSDKGTEWEIKHTLSPGFFTLRGFKCKNADTLIAESTFISAASYDGMTTLDSIIPPEAEWYYSEFFWAGHRLYHSFVRNDSTFLYVSEDAAASWSPVNLFTREPDDPAPYFPNLVQAYRNEDTAYFFHNSKSDRLFMTTDGGYTLTEHLHSGVDFPPGADKMFLHPGTDYLYMPFSWYGVLRINTTTWAVNTMMSSETDTLKTIDIDFYRDTVYALAPDGWLLYSYDNGDQWHRDTVFHQPQSFSISPSGDIIVATYDKVFLKKRETTSNPAPVPGGSGFLIYPNPAQDVISIEGLNGHHILSVEVYNLAGQKVHTGSGAQIHCQGWSPGHYFLSIKDSDGIHSFYKFIKE